MQVSHLEEQVWTEINVCMCCGIQKVIQADLSEIFLLKQSWYAAKMNSKSLATHQ